MAKTIEMVALTSMPMSCAAPLSSEQARMALPILVRWVKSVRPTMTAMQVSTVTMDSGLTLSCPPKNERVGSLTTLGKTFGSLFQMSRAEFCRK